MVIVSLSAHLHNNKKPLKPLGTQAGPSIYVYRTMVRKTTSPNFAGNKLRIYFIDSIHMLRKLFFSIGFILLFALSCSKDEKLNLSTINDYYPLTVGKYITYQADSTVYTDFGTKEEIHGYQMMDIVDAEITDNMGRPSYRIRRMIRDSLGQNPWADLESYMVTPINKSIELVENNFRYIKLKEPFTEGASWKGNAYISISSDDPNWDYRYLDDWDYTLANVDQPNSVNGYSIDSSITVNQIDEIVGYPDIDTLYSERNYSVEMYGKGIGLSFKDFLHWEYQPPTPGKPAYKTGYGLRLSIIDHN